MCVCLVPAAWLSDEYSRSTLDQPFQGIFLCDLTKGSLLEFVALIQMKEVGAGTMCLS